jgi:hypothetical protein
MTAAAGSIPTCVSLSSALASVHVAPAIRLHFASAAHSLDVARRLFVAAHSDSSSSDRSLFHRTRSSPRGFYRFHGVPASSSATSPVRITAFQHGPADTRALRQPYFAPHPVPDACVHDNAPLADAALLRDVDAVFRDLNALCADLLRHMVSLDARIEPLIRAPLDSYVEFKRYSLDSHPAPDAAAAAVAMNEHRDQTLLTLLIQSPPPTPIELQVKAFDSPDHWLSTLDHAGSNDCAIVHIGDLLERATHGRFRSTVHRVVATAPTPPAAPRERFSIALFCMPSWHVRIDDETLAGDLLPVY